MIGFGKNAVNPFKRLPLSFLVVAIGMLIARLLTAEFVRPFRMQTHLLPTHLRLDSLLFGVILAYYFHFHRERFSKVVSSNLKKIALAGCGFLSPLLFIGQFDQWMYTYGFTSAFLGYGCLMIAFLHVEIHSEEGLAGALLRAVAYVGTFSYSIYLLHAPWLALLQALPLGGTAARLVWFYGGSIFMGILFGRLIEIPALRLREVFFPRPTAEILLAGTPTANLQIQGHAEARTDGPTARRHHPAKKPPLCHAESTWPRGET